MIAHAPTPTGRHRPKITPERIAHCKADALAFCAANGFDFAGMFDASWSGTLLNGRGNCLCRQRELLLDHLRNVKGHSYSLISRTTTMGTGPIQDSLKRMGKRRLMEDWNRTREASMCRVGWERGSD